VERDRELESMTRERNLYKHKYNELKGKFHEYQQRLSQPVDITNTNIKPAVKRTSSNIEEAKGQGSLQNKAPATQNPETNDDLLSF
jgi:hypothetical protein